MNKDKIEEIKEVLKTAKSEFFGERETLTEAQNYALKLLKASSPEERDICTATAIGVYHNTLVNVFMGIVEEIENE